MLHSLPLFAPCSSRPLPVVSRHPSHINEPHSYTIVARCLWLEDKYVIELNCWVFGGDSSPVFLVKIAATESVGTLKEAIKDKKKPAFDHLTADSLDLWKVSDLDGISRDIHQRLGSSKSP